METNFAALTPVQKLAWARETWAAARDLMFLKKFSGTGENNVIQVVKELTKTDKGAEACVIQLVADLVGDGVRGDNEREGNEESMKSHSQIITYDLLSHGVKNTGKLSDQRTTINFRQQGRDKLSYWLANRCDQLAFLTMSGISYEFNNDGSRRDAGSVFPSLDFAADVRPPSAKRSLMWDGTGLDLSNTGAIASSFKPNYNMIVQATTYAKENRIKPLMAGGKPHYVVFVQPGTLGLLKQDQAYREAVTAVAARDGQNSPWFTGAMVTIDGAVIQEFNLVYNTKGAAAGQKWGAGGNVNGTRTLVCGAQALGMADLGPGDWDEKKFQYSSQVGLNIDKFIGFLKPQFPSIYNKSVEDFGLFTIDHYLP